MCRLCKPKQQKQADSRSKQRETTEETSKVVSVECPEPQEDSERMNMIRNSGMKDPILMDLLLSDIPIQMEFDTGASVSVINQATFERVNLKGTLLSLGLPQVQLRSYTGESIPMVATITLRARY